MPEPSAILDTLTKHDATILAEWVKYHLAATTRRRDLIDETTLREQSRRFLDAFRAGLQRDGGDVMGSAWDEAREVLGDLSHTRAQQGFSPAETATFVFSLKQPLFEQLRKDLGQNAGASATPSGRSPPCSTPSASSPPRFSRKDANRSSIASSRTCWNSRHRWSSSGKASSRCR